MSDDSWKGYTTKWYGYKHVNGSYHVKRFFSYLDIQETQESPFVQSVTGTFEAKDREHALQQTKDRLR